MMKYYYLKEILHYILEMAIDTVDILFTQSDVKVILLELKNNQKIYLTWGDRVKIQKYKNTVKDIKLFIKWTYKDGEFDYIDYISLEDLLNNRVEPPRLGSDFHSNLWEISNDYNLQQLYSIYKTIYK